jgi:hypothetical protein
MTQDYFNWLDALVAQGAEFTILSGPVWDKEYHCKLIIAEDKTQLTLKAGGPSLAVCVEELNRKLHAVNSGEVRFAGPFLEHTAKVAGPTSDDEIPL